MRAKHDGKVRGNTAEYYMASSASGQDEPNRALRLATRAGKMGYLALAGIPAVSRKKISPKAI